MLTDVKVKNARAGEKPVKLSDQGGLYLEVMPSGSKLWRYKFRLSGKESRFSLGAYPDVTIAQAREAHALARKLVGQGINPVQQRKTEKLVAISEGANTFKVIAEEWIRKKKHGWAAYYLRQVERFFAGDAYPAIGELPMRQITAAHVLAILKKAEARGAESVAVNLRQWIGAVFRYAVSTLRADFDPAAALKGAIIKPATKHSKPLTIDEMSRMIKAIEENGGYTTTRIALRLMLLTFVRTVELRGARWEEFDLDAAVWKIPGERMKKRLPHAVPLSVQAIELLRELHLFTGNQQWLFPNGRRPKDCMCATTLNRALERMGFAGKDGIGFSGHGFRSTASTMLNGAGFKGDVIERQLAHVEKNAVRRAYNQAEYMPERIQMMQAWADLVDAVGKDDGKVVLLKAVA